MSAAAGYSVDCALPGPETPGIRPGVCSDQAQWVAAWVPSSVVLEPLFLSRLAIRFSCAVFIGFFLPFFFASIPLLMVFTSDCWLDRFLMREGLTVAAGAKPVSAWCLP